MTLNDIDPHTALQKDLDFLMSNVLSTEHVLAMPRFKVHGIATISEALRTAGGIAQDYFKPHNRTSDLNPPKLVEGNVQIIPEVKTAIDKLNEAGFTAATFDEEDGGFQMPMSVFQACMSHFYLANVATSSFVFLSVGVANLIAAFGSEELKAIYLPAILEGRFLGTMALTEPSAGSSLADVRTFARPDDDGQWRISGEKIFISGGDHELSENIVHMILARTEESAGTAGLSLFLVPKCLVAENGAVAKRNGVSLAGLIHKMGWRGITSTHLKFGEKDPCIGYLVGERGKGLSHMFQMMNEARIAVGMCGAMLAYAGYRDSLRYAHERTQGRRPGGKVPDSCPIPIIDHSDVRRMILCQKSIAEGALTLCLYAAELVDRYTGSTNEYDRRSAKTQLDFVTPIVKTWCAENGLRANFEAIQILGGYGYTQDFPVEQYYRDNRLNPIHEGTTGIQAGDFLLRKIAMDDGAAFADLYTFVKETIQIAMADPALAVNAEALETAWIDLDEIVHHSIRAIAAGHAEQALENAVAVLQSAGHSVVGWLWLRQACAASAKRSNLGDFAEGKIAACSYFCTYELPTVARHRSIITNSKPFFSELRPECL